MSETEDHETCSLNNCLGSAVHSERGTVGHWHVTIFYCDEHHRELDAGTPLGALGVDPSKLRIESVEGSEIPTVTNRFPGIA
jgi:hypothetical protein